MKILYIGGSGNISRDCVLYSLEFGHTTAALTRGSKPLPEGCRSILADRKNIGEMHAAVESFNPDVVVNFIGYTVDELMIDLEVFADKVDQYIFISSATVYAKPNPVPVTEESPLGNRYSEYAQNKERCEQFLLSHLDKLPATIVRPSHTYSEDWMPNIVSSAGYTFADRILNSRPVFVVDEGQSLWTLTHTKDFAVGLNGLIGNREAVGETFHITSDQVLTWNEIYAETARALGVHHLNKWKIPSEFIRDVSPELAAKLQGDKANHAIFDNAKIKRFVPEFNCTTTFAEGIRKSIDNFHKHPDKKNVDESVNAIWDHIIEQYSENNR